LVEAGLQGTILGYGKVVLFNGNETLADFFKIETIIFFGKG